MSIFRPASLNGIATGKNVANYKASAEMELGTVVSLNDTTKVFSPSATGVYAVWQYADADAHLLGTGTNSAKVAKDEFARLIYLPAFKGLKDGIEVGGAVIAETDAIAIGDKLVANSVGKYELVGAGAATYPIALVITDIIAEHDGKRYICEVITDLVV